MLKNEEDVLAYWRANNIMQEMRARNRGRKPFYFLDGPPFVSGDLHPGQMWVKSMKDVFLRYRRMKGYDVYDRAGYDVHGLPIELRAEANLNVKSKKEIETKIGVENFVKACREYVDAYIGKMDADYERFGISLDFSNPYVPYKKDYMETEWGFFKNIYEKGLVYNEKKAVPYCTRCGTVLSQGSMEMVYKDDTDPSIFVAFKITSSQKLEISNDTYLLVWTTTPWTLPANIAIAANPEEKYVLVKIKDRHFILAEARLDAAIAEIGESGTVEKEFYGSELIGTMYESPLEEKVPMQKEYRKYHKVIGAKEIVSIEEGTGLVHIAPGHGLDDYVIGVKNKLPIFSPVNTEGIYTDEAGAYKGLKVPDEANKKVLEDLQSLGALISSGELTHSYPHCWRCDTKLIYIATNQWFINIQKVKKRLISENKKISWHPEEAKEWQEDLLQNSPDWAVSRQRYWGVPIPIWQCENGHRLVIGSLDELKAHAINPEYVEKMTDLHMPYIDNVVLKCPECGKEMHRVKDVFDVWFDSSIAYRASLTDEQFNKLFPVDFVLEAIEQLRGWFAYQLKTSVIAYGKRPFKNVVMHGMMLGEDGRELHKHLNNYIPLHELLKQVTADSFRLWCTSHNPKLDLLFRIKDIKEADKVILLLYNIANLYKEYSDAIGYVPSKVKRPRRPELLDFEDAWILSKLSRLVKLADKNLSNYNIYDTANAIRSFIVEDFSRMYLKIAKKKIAYESKARAKAKIDLINYVLYNTLLIASPIIPFVTEKLYLQLYGYKKSIFLNDWPKVSESYINDSLEKEFEYATNAITALLNAREKAGIKLRQPLEKGTIEVESDEAYNAILKLSEIIEDYTNIKKIEVKKTSKIGKQVIPLFQKIGPEFRENANAVAQALKEADADSLEKEIAEKGTYTLHTSKGAFTITHEHFSIVARREQQDAVAFEQGIASIDKEISTKLKEEALIREFERHIQILRKQAQMRKSDSIVLYFESGKGVEEIIEKHRQEVKKDVNAEEIKQNVPENDPELLSEEFQLEGENVKAAIKKFK